MKKSTPLCRGNRCTQLASQQDLRHELWPDVPFPTGVPGGRRWFATSWPNAGPRALLVSPPQPGERGQAPEEPGLHGGEPLHSPGGPDAVPAGFRRPGVPGVRDLWNEERAETGKMVLTGLSEEFVLNYLLIIIYLLLIVAAAAWTYMD